MNFMIQGWDLIISSNSQGTYGVASIFDTKQGITSKALVYQNWNDGMYIVPMEKCN